MLALYLQLYFLATKLSKAVRKKDGRIKSHNYGKTFKCIVDFLYIFANIFYFVSILALLTSFASESKVTKFQPQYGANQPRKWAKPVRFFTQQEISMAAETSSNSFEHHGRF